MYKSKRILAIIPARGGSKGIPNKNIIDLDGKPLIQYSIDAANASKYIDRIVVSTDSVEIAEVAKRGGADVPGLRPDYLASDEAKSIDVLLHMVNKLKKSGDKYDYIVLLQPTQPLRQGFHIDEAIKMLINRKATSLASVATVRNHPILMRTVDAGEILNGVLKTNSTVRRQDFPDYYYVNGSIYINKLDHTFNENTSLNDNELGYIMDSKYDIDIDEPMDLEIAKIKMKHLSKSTILV